MPYFEFKLEGTNKGRVFFQNFKKYINITTKINKINNSKQFFFLFIKIRVI